MPNGQRAPRLIGEFFVIVVGVFVALAAESWYQNWSEGRGLEGYVDRLITDVESDSATFGFVLDVLDRKDSSIEATAEVAAGLAAPDTTFFRTLVVTTSMGFQTPGARRATYDDLIATGNLRLIDDDELRSGIVAYYEWMEGQWARIENRRTDYSRMVYRLNPSYWESGKLGPAGPTMREQAIDSVRTFHFMNLLSAEQRLSTFQRDLMHDAMGRATEMLGILRLARASI